MTGHDFNQLRHDLRTSVNHILGYSQLIQESAADFSDESTALRAKTIHAYGWLLASRIEEVSAAAIHAPDRDPLEALQLASLALVEQILQAASGDYASSGASAYADDLQRICKAANHVRTLVKAP